MPIQGRTVAIQVLARRDVKHVRPDVPYIVVSIADRMGVHPTLLEPPHRLGVLRVAFDDVEPTRRDHPGGKRPMDASHAREIRAFVEAHPEAELIVVQCEAGMCRSPAVAAALWRWLEGSRGPFFETFRPNRHVYRTLSEELG